MSRGAGSERLGPRDDAAKLLRRAAAPRCRSPTSSTASVFSWLRRSLGEVLALAGLIELAQDILYAHGKTFEWWDVRDDAIGILIAFLAVRIIRSRSVRSKTG